MCFGGQVREWTGICRIKDENASLVICGDPSCENIDFCPIIDLIRAQCLGLEKGPSAYQSLLDFDCIVDVQTDTYLDQWFLPHPESLRSRDTHLTFANDQTTRTTASERHLSMLSCIADKSESHSRSLFCCMSVAVLPTADSGASTNTHNINLRICSNCIRHLASTADT